MQASILDLEEVPDFLSLFSLTAAGKLPHVTPLARPGKDATCWRT